MLAEEKLIIEPYKNGSGDFPIKDFLENLPRKDFHYIVKKLSYFQGYSISQLKNSRHLEIVRGHNEFWELKFHHISEYRAVCILRKNKIILLEMFKGSGSRGNVTRYIEKCLERVKVWDKNYP